MKSKMFKKLMAAVIATTMTVGLAACGTEENPTGGDASPAPGGAPNQGSTVTPDATPEPEVGSTTVLTDANGNVYDLGGMEIIIRDWWSDPNAEPSNQYDEDTAAYREEIQKTYNFKITQMAISDWGSAPQDFVDYVTTGGDDQNYVFILRDDPTLTSAMANGLCYDLSTLDCLDFTEEKFTSNLLHKQYSKAGKIYAMYAGASEPRTGVYFNKRLLEEAGINPEELYDKQADGTWTWDAFLEYLEKVQQDTNNDGVIDVYGANANNSSLTNIAVFSNGGEYVGQDASGKYIYRLEDAQTMEGLNYAQQIFDTYWQVEPEGANWDYYKEGFLNGEYAFMIEDAYAGQKNGFLADMEDDFGFVMFPKGPQMKDYTNCWSNNPAVIPACYDAERAWKIAFAWNLYTNDTPGYENSDSWKAGYYEGFRDTRAVDETLAMMRSKGMITYDGVIPNLKRGEDFTWGIAPGSVVSTAVEGIRDTWKSYIDDANK